ncbi:MAG: hypothetical protein ACRET2_14990, partial [Steroidobacteraceae bacterium]
MMRAALLLPLAMLFPGANAHPRSPAGAGPQTRELLPDSMTSSFTVSGVNVIVRRNTATDVVAANLYLLGGTRQATDSTVGVEPMLLWVSEQGTSHYSRDALRRKTADLGSTIVVEPRHDWTMFGFRGIRETFDSTWMLLSDRLMHGTTDSTAVELVRSQVLSAV